jgi:hypothetical protein
MWNCLKENQGPLTLITTLLLVIITGVYVLYTKDLSESAQKQIQLQINQYQLDNRPSVFISGWGEFQKFKDMQTIRFTLRNVGKLPAKFDGIEYRLIVGGKNIDIDSKDFLKPAVIFPTQENIHIDLPIPNSLGPLIKNYLGFTITLRLTYYSINDVKKQYQFSYSVKYLLRMNNPNSKTIDEYILQEIDAN